jgi:surfactin synthase thioesterase subunit
MSTASTWVQRTPQPSPRARLLCFPYGGGGASYFRAWQELLGEEIEVCAIQLPGREGRYSEPRLREIEPLLTVLRDELAPLLQGPPVHLFGYSLGAGIAHAFATQCLQESTRADIRSIIACACSAGVQDRRDTGTYTDESFLAFIDSLGGLPAAVMANPGLRAIALGILRDDFSLAESINLADAPPISVPVMALGGDSDPSVSLAGLEAWRNKTTATFERHLYCGDHFFFNQHAPSALARIKEHVLRNDD